MNGPRHYKYAETFLEKSQEKGLAAELVAAMIATAQVHATLALVAATLDAGLGIDHEKQWKEVTK